MAARAWPQQSQALTYDGVLASETACLQLFQGAHGGEIRVLGKQLLQERLEGINDAVAWTGPGDPSVPLSLHLCQRACHGATRQAQFFRDGTQRHPTLTPLHDLQTQRLIHGSLIRLRSGPNTNSATTWD